MQSSSSPSISGVSLIVLAGGMGSRFGGLKQLVPLGPRKQTILEYTLDDAQAIGIQKVVFLIRRAIEAEFREVILEKLFRRPFEIKLAYQEISPVLGDFQTNSARQRPWGTGHALLTAYQALRTPSAVVVNADDYYGRNALHQAAQAASWGRNAVIGYDLRQTLSPRGPVSRGILQLDAHHRLLDIHETHGLTPANAPQHAWASMNCLSISPSIAKPLQDNWINFCQQGGLNSLEAECLLPDALREALRQAVPIQVIPTTDPWMGLTHRDDLPDVELKIGR